MMETENEEYKKALHIVNILLEKDDFKIFVDRYNSTQTNNSGDIAKIIKYDNANDIVIEFQDEHKYCLHTNYSNFQKGSFKNPYHKSVYGVGCIGNANSRNETGNKKHSYTIWFAMLQRCYKDCYYKKKTYLDCYVCDEWLCFETFEKWFDENYYEIPNAIMDLDKDIFRQGNKIYSPETCCFVPQDINKCFMERDNSSGLPSGVYKNKSGTYGARTCKSWDGKSSVRLGTYNTAEEANQAFLKYKYQCIKEKANFYKDYLPEYIYNKLIELGSNI